MHLTKYTEGWTRRHFLEQVSKGVFAAGVLSRLMDVIGRNGNCEAAYPPELLSIEAYTRGELKAGEPRLLMGIVMGAFVGVVRSCVEFDQKIESADWVFAEQCVWEAIRS